MARRITIVVGALIAIGLTTGIAEARRRGPSKAQLAAQKEKKEQAAAMKAAVSKAQKAKDAELMKKYDLNKNGKIDGNEKPSWDKFWREVDLGQIPHPYSTIKLDKDDLKTSASKKK